MTNIPDSSATQHALCRFYTREDTVSFEEDATHEFKGHINICLEDIPAHSVITHTDRRSRQPISRALNGFLNAGREATVYCGIVDDGRVLGINLTIYRMDHIIAAVSDLFGRYDPPVEPHRYYIEFIPVVDVDSTEEEKIKVTTFNPGQDVTARQRDQEHQLRQPTYCWCTIDQLAKLEHGTLAPDYVIEIHIKAWDPTHPNNKNAVGAMKAPPVHTAEDHKAYFRQHAIVQMATPMELYELKKQYARHHYQNIIKRLKDQLREVREELLK